MRQTYETLSARMILNVNNIHTILLQKILGTLFYQLTEVCTVCAYHFIFDHRESTNLLKYVRYVHIISFSTTVNQQFTVIMADLFTCSEPIPMLYYFICMIPSYLAEGEEPGRSHTNAEYDPHCGNEDISDDMAKYMYSNSHHL